MQPFLHLMSDLDGIMPAHVIYPSVDERPAGFSPYWLQTVLRERLNYTGVLFSDDLTMQAAHFAGSLADRIMMAFSAGIDMALVCGKSHLTLQVLDELATPKPDAVNPLLANFADHYTRNQ